MSGLQNIEMMASSRERTRALLCVVWGLLVASLSWSFLHEVFKQSFQNGYSSQSVLVPFITAYLLWSERKRIFSRPRLSAYLGVPIVVIGILFTFAAPNSVISATAAILPDIKMLGILLMAVGGFAALYGVDALRSAAFPFALLLLTLPLPGPLIDRIIYFLQAQSTSLAYGLFSLIGMPVYREGFILRMPGVSIEVAKECSGINSSVALLITALLVARETLRTSWRRAILVLITVPLSVLKNAVRIVTLTLLAMYVDPSFLTGRLHHEGGFVFFLIALVLVYPIWKLLQKSELHHPSQSGDAAPASSQVLSQASGR